MVLSASNAFNAVVVGEVSWANTLCSVDVVDQVFWARKALSGVGIPVGVGGTSKALSVLVERS